MEYNVTALNEEITKIEQAKSNMSNILYEKGRPVTNNSALSDIVSNILPLSNIRRYNTNVEKNLDRTVDNGTVSMVYGPYVNSDNETEFVTNIYLPKQLSITSTDVRNLGANVILGKLLYKSNSNEYLLIKTREVDSKYQLVVEMLDDSLNLDDILYDLDGNNVYTRTDNDNGYKMINIPSTLIFDININTKSICYEILQNSSSYVFGGLYLYNSANWEPLPLGVTANISTVFNGYTALTDDGIVTGIGTADATAIAGDIWKNTAYANGTKLTGTLQVTNNVTRQELDSKIDMWNTFTNFSTTSNDLSYLMDNLQQPVLPTITAIDVVNMAGMYNNCTNVVAVDIFNINTINTINMDNVFNNCRSILNINVNSFITTNVCSTRHMFDNCVNVMSIDITNWNVTNLKDTTSMFENCKNSTNLNVAGWNTYNVELMPYMFKNCQRMENISFVNWNTSNVTNMEAIFESCDRFTNESIANVVNMLPDATQLTNNNAFNLGIDMDRYTAEQLYQLRQKNYSGVPLLYNVYYNIVNLDDGTYYLLNKGDDLDINGTKLSGYIFNLCSMGITNMMIGDTKSKQGTLQNLAGFLNTNGNLVIELNLCDLNVSNVTSLNSAFSLCSNLCNLNLSNWDTSNVVGMYRMFNNCYKLTNLDLSNLNTKNVVNMGRNVYELL